MSRAVVNQDRHPLVDLRRQLGIRLAAKDRAGMGIRIDERNVVGRQSEPATFVEEIGDALDLKSKRCWFVVCGTDSQGRKTLAIVRTEKPLTYREKSDQRFKPLAFDECCEKSARRFIGSDASRT
jgi:hypothetical protein